MFNQNCSQDFPGGSVVKTLCSQSKGPGVLSLVGELDPKPHGEAKEKQKVSFY